MNVRPVYLDLFRIRLPLPGLISFAHRISGVVLFLTMPFALDVLERSLDGPVGFAMAHQLVMSFWLAPFILLITWSLCHHMLAGVRFLLMDIDVGLGKRQSNQSAAWVGWGALLLTLLLMLEFYL